MIKSGIKCHCDQRLPIFAASRSPRGSSGRSRSVKAVASQYDLAWRSRYSDYDGSPISNDELQLLERTGSGDGMRVMLLTERVAIEKLLEYVVAGNTAQMNDPAFGEEL